MAKKKEDTKGKKGKAKKQDDEFDDLLDGQGAQAPDAPSEAVVNLDDIDTSELQPIPAGTYAAILDAAEFKQSKAGNPMVSWTFEITTEKYAGRKVFSNTVTHKPLGLMRLKQTVVSLGYDGDLSEFDLNEGPQELIGNACRVQVGLRNYEGRANNDVRNVLPADDASDDMP